MTKKNITIPQQLIDKIGTTIEVNGTTYIITGIVPVSQRTFKVKGFEKEPREKYKKAILEWQQTTKDLSQNNRIFAFMPGENIGEFTR